MIRSGWVCDSLRKGLGDSRRALLQVEDSLWDLGQRSDLLQVRKCQFGVSHLWGHQPICAGRNEKSKLVLHMDWRQRQGWGGYLEVGRWESFWIHILGFWRTKQFQRCRRLYGTWVEVFKIWKHVEWSTLHNSCERTLMRQGNLLKNNSRANWSIDWISPRLAGDATANALSE